MTPAGLGVGTRRQALSAIVPVRAGEEAGLEAELRLRRNQWASGLKRCAALHFAKLAVLPEPAGGAALLVETSFEGSLGDHLAELWQAAGTTWSDILRHCEGGQGLGLEGFRRLIDRHVVRVEAACSAHGGLARAVIDNDARLDQLAQAFLDQEQVARGIAGRGPVELVERLRAELSAHGELWLGSLAAPASAPAASGAWSRALDRLACLGLRLLERIGGKSARSVEGTVEPRAGEICLQTTWLAVAPAPTGFRRWALGRLLRSLRERAEPPLDAMPAEFSQLHAARWVELPDRRLLVSLTHDGSRESFRAFSPRSLARYLAFYAEAFELRAQIWYSAYPELSVSDVLRNHRIRELFARPLDRDGARALSALL